jgi:hypothetical protein
VPTFKFLDAQHAQVAEFAGASQQMLEDELGKLEGM